MQQDGKLQPRVFGSYAEHLNYTTTLQRVLDYWFFFLLAYKTANYIITYWKGGNDRESSAGDLGFLVMQRTAVKDYHQNMTWAGKATSQTSPLRGLSFPCCFQAGCRLCLFLRSDSQCKFPQWEPTTWAVPAVCSLAQFTSLHSQEFYFVSWPHKPKALEENNLKPFENGNSLPFLLTEASCHKVDHDSVP